MKAILLDILRNLESRIQELNKESRKESLPELTQARITLLGQFSLFADAEFVRVIQLVATADVDAQIQANWQIKKIFKELLLEQGLEYDELSSEIWIPPNSDFRLLYESREIRCQYLSPLYSVLSKAIKAPEKNRILVKKSIELFGQQLTSLIEMYGGNLSFFE